jgi:hypothetical protein
MGSALVYSTGWNASGQGQEVLPPSNIGSLLTEVQRRAFRFFWEQADPRTGLVKDRANNSKPDSYEVASIAAVGYGLAALPVAVSRKWVSRKAAEQRAEWTLRFQMEQMAHQHGWLYHFIHWQTGERMWNCEISTIDTGLLVLGALACGQFFAKSEVQRLANALYDRLDWQWMLTNGGAEPDKKLISHGWRPEEGFLKNNWHDFSECILLYLLGAGAQERGLTEVHWNAWERDIYRYGTWETLKGGPIFLHQMPYLYYDVRGMRDRLGFDYGIAAENAMRIHRQFCIDNPTKRKGYGAERWGLNASDGPKGYMAYGVPSPEDGTLSPTGLISALIFLPDEVRAAALSLTKQYGGQLWGRYGFPNAYNEEANWIDPDVIGIDLGMALLAIENARTGLIWRLIRSHPSTKRAFEVAGMRRTRERAPRALRNPVGSRSN